MSSSTISQRRGKYYTPIWTCVFLIGLAATCAAFYYATLNVDYVWRWYSVPQYFMHQQSLDVTSTISGSVASINDKGNDIVVVVKGDGESEQYTLPKDAALRVEANSNVFPGDTIGTYKRWRTGILLEGLWLTLKVSMLAIVLGIIFGLLAGLCRISENPALKWTAITYIELIRGSPLLVQIFIWYFVGGTVINKILSQYSLPSIPSLWYGVFALAIFTGAYVAEIVRAGIQSVHKGQMEAARSLGMTKAQAMREVILPQAFRRILPPLAGQFISLIKDSSLLGIIAIRELTKATREIVTTSLQPFELWFACAVLYLVLTFALSLFVQYLEKRTVMA